MLETTWYALQYNYVAMLTNSQVPHIRADINL